MEARAGWKKTRNSMGYSPNQLFFLKNIRKDNGMLMKMPIKVEGNTVSKTRKNQGESVAE